MFYYKHFRAELESLLLLYIEFPFYMSSSSYYYCCSFSCFEDRITEAYDVCMLQLSDITSMFGNINLFVMFPTFRISVIIFHFRNRKQLALV